MLSSTLASVCDDLFLVRGRQQILQLAPALQELARRTNQLGAMNWLEYFFDTRSLASKPPYLVLQLCNTSTLKELRSNHILAAALFFEYRVAGLHTGVFATDDAVGFRTVIAPSEDRAGFAERAAHALLSKGAHMVLATYEIPQATASIAEPFPGRLHGYRQRRVRRILKLAPTFDELLSRIGRLTRRNLRYYRRHLGSRLELNFVEDVRPYLTFDQFRALDSASMNPVRCERELWLRWRCGSEDPSSFIAGLRAEGKWLGLLGGWRQDSLTVLHWQLNSRGYEQESIGTIMRSFFLEHEIKRGAQKLLMFGGTPHSIRHSFEEDTIADLLVCRPTARSQALRLLARQLTTYSRLARNNHLLQTLAALPLSEPLPWSPQYADAMEQSVSETSRAA